MRSFGFLLVTVFDIEYWREILGKYQFLMPWADSVETGWNIPKGLLTQGC